jgi:hypothetical protein
LSGLLVEILTAYGGLEQWRAAVSPLALGDLIAIAPPDRKRRLENEADLVKRLVARSFEEGHDRELGAEPDQQGIGSVGGSESG